MLDLLLIEVFVLFFLMCGFFSERILEVNFWLSLGGICSMLYKDVDNVINCLFNGIKDWIFIYLENE